MDNFYPASRRNIPVELTDLFIDYTHDDLPTLLACALVSPRWTTASRYHAFSNVEVSHERARQFIQLLSSPHCTISGVLRGLTIHFVPGSQRWFDEFSRRLSSFDGINITSLTLSGSRNTTIREEVKLALTAYFPRVRHFKVTTVVFNSFAEFGTLLCNFRALQSLSCASTFRHDAVPQDVHFAAPLRTLDLISPSISPVFTFLLEHGALPTISSLSLSHPTADDYPNLTRYLSTTNEILQNLSIRMDGPFSGVTIDDFEERLDMQQLRTLRNLIIDVAPALAPDQAFRILSSIRSTQLATMQIALQLVQGVARIDILLSSGRFVSLRKLVVLRASWDDARQFLPRCGARDILRAA